jgi:hypothetical protein
MTGQDQPYTNSIILNNKVLVPFMGSNWDDSAKAVYQAAMPGYTVKGFIGSPSTPWESTDALHCRVMGIADVGLLYIRHIPLSGNQPCENGYTITAEIINCSHQPVIPDSVLIHYKVNTGSFVTISMTGNGSSLFTGIIPQQPAGSVVRYYLSAADQSGRHSEMPFTGVSDPFKFQTIYTKLTFKPDTLWFHEHYEAFYGKLFSIHNNLTTGVSLNTVQMEGYDPPWWVDSLSVPALPFTINPEDSVTAIVKVPIPVEKNPQDYYADSLRITSSAGEQYLPIRINPDILNSADQTVPGAEIRANYPNPFMVETIIPYYSPRNGKVILEVYDIRGTLVRNLVNGYITAGLHKVVWDGTNDIGRMLPGGIYLCRLSTGNTIDTRRMVFIR